MVTRWLLDGHSMVTRWIMPCGLNLHACPQNKKQSANERTSERVNEKNESESAGVSTAGVGERLEVSHPRPPQAGVFNQSVQRVSYHTEVTEGWEEGVFGTTQSEGGRRG